MFNVAQKRAFSRTVKVQVPIDGGFREDTLKATYRVLDRGEHAAHNLTTPEGAYAFLIAVIERLDDLVDADKQPVPYSDEVRDHVLSLPYTPGPLIQQYLDGVRGAGAGNSAGPPRHG